MALRFMDGFDHYGTADLIEKWTGINNTPAVSAGTGRRGTASCRCTLLSYVSLTLDAQPTWIVGCAIQFTAMVAMPCALVQWLDATTIQCDLALTSAGTLIVRRNGVTTLGTTTNVLSINTMYYLEFRLLIDNAAGQADVHVDGIPWLSLTDVDTQQSGTATANAMKCGQVDGSIGTLDIDDLYICDGTGSAPHNTFLGDCRVDTLLPTADGSHSAWTCSTGTAHAALVDEVAPNDDTDYLSTSTAAARDTHAMGNTSGLTTATILGVQHCMSAKKEDAGTCAIKNVLKSGATTQAGATSHALSTSYAYYRELWTTDPNTDAAWTTAAIDAVEAGVEKV